MTIGLCCRLRCRLRLWIMECGPEAIVVKHVESDLVVFLLQNGNSGVGVCVDISGIDASAFSK